MRSSVKQVLSMVRLLAPLRTVRNWFVKAPQTISPMEHLKQYAAKLGIKVIPSREVIDVCRGKDTIRISTSHEIYTHDMVKYFDYYFRAVSPDLKSDQRIVDYSYPRLHCLQPSGVELEFPSLPESDETTEVYLKALDLQPGDCMLDLGAYAGASAYFFSKAVGPDGLVIAFEPDQKTFPYLLGNIKRHQLINVNPVAKGVWKETTTLRFSSEGNMGAAVVSVVGRELNSSDIQVVTLEDVAAMAVGRRIAAIKMDIEGAEVPVLENAQDFLNRHRPRIIIEPHSIDGQMNTSRVCELLRKSGYRVETITQGSQDSPLVLGIPS